MIAVWSNRKSIVSAWREVPSPGSKALKGARKKPRRRFLTCAVYAGSLGAATLAAASAAAEVPRQLYGKSVAVSWTETRSQRFVGEGTGFRTVTPNFQISIYFSTAGRSFSRIAASSRGGGGSLDNIGPKGVSTTGGLRLAQFHGNSLVGSAEFRGGARRVAVNFDSGFDSCSAQVIIGKQVGARTMVMRLLGSQRNVEIESASAGPASCSIRNGNVFGE